MTTGPIGASLKYISINSNCNSLTEYYSNGKNINIPIHTTTAGCIGPTGIDIINITLNECGDIDGYYSNNTIARFGKIIVTGVTGITGEQGPLYGNLLIGNTGPLGPTGLPNSTINYVGTGFFSIPNDISYTTVINELRQPNTYYPTYFGSNIHSTNDTAVILTNFLYNSTAANYSVFIGGAPTEADYYYQDANAISIGGHTTVEQEGPNAIAIGESAGTSQYTNSIAIGFYAGKQHSGDGMNSIAIGSYAAIVNQNDDSIALGNISGSIAQNTHSISIGSNAGSYLQDNYSIAIGEYAGYQFQQGYSIAIGNQSGYTDLGLYSISIGLGAGSEYSPNCINIGISSGEVNQQELTIAIGSFAGNSNQSIYSIGIGQESANSSQGERSIAIGQYSAYDTQRNDSVAIGYQSGNILQNSNSIAIGNQSGYNGQSEYNVAIGSYSGYNLQDTRTVSIGTNSGNNQLANSTIIGFISGTISTDTECVVLGSNISSTLGLSQSMFTITDLIPVNSGTILLYDYNTGKIGPLTSSNRFKENIVPLSDDYTQNLSKLKVKRFNGNSIGLIAEQVVKYYPEIVNIDEQGKPHSINYTLLNVLLLKQLQILKQKIK